MMKKNRNLLSVLLASISVICLCLGVFGCGQTTPKISFKDTFPAFLTVNESFDVGEHVEREKGTSLTVQAEYLDKDGTKKNYETFGTSFMPTVVGDVTIIVGVRGEKGSISKTVPVKIAQPQVLKTDTVIVYRDQEYELSSLKSGLTVAAPQDRYDFKVKKAVLLGGDLEIDLSNLTKYTFTECGMYEVEYVVSNEGGSVEGKLYVRVKMVLTENEEDDLSNYGEGLLGENTGKVIMDEEDSAENSDWSFVIWANPSAVGSSVTDYSENYWTNFGMLKVDAEGEGSGIDLSKYYLEFDVKFSADSRDLIAIRMVDEAKTLTSDEVTFNRNAEMVDGEYGWQHVSMKDKYKYGTYAYIRFMIMHPLTSDPESYDPANVYVKIDNVKLCEYDEPYEYHEQIDYVVTNDDYIAEDGEFETAVDLWEDLKSRNNPAYIIQKGEYANEVTEVNFTLSKASAGAYEFYLTTRLSEEQDGEFANGVNVLFKRDAINAFYVIYVPGQENDVYAEECLFEDGHNYTLVYGVVDDSLVIRIKDVTAGAMIIDKEYDLSQYEIPEKGSFAIRTFKNLQVGIKKPHVYTKPIEGYVLENDDYLAEEGEFETAVEIGGTKQDEKLPTYIIQKGEYDDEVAEVNFTISDASIGAYDFFLMARLTGEVGNFENCVSIRFNRDAGNAYYAVILPNGSSPAAAVCFFTNGHNYTVTYGIIGSNLMVKVVDNTAGTELIDNKHDLSSYTFATVGSFAFRTDKNVQVSVKKPYTYVKPTDPAEVTISNFSIGSRNTETTLDIVIGSGQIQSDFHSVGQGANLCAQGGDFSQVSTVGPHKIFGIVGVLTTSRTSIVLFPNANYVEKGTAIIIPKNATIVIGEQTVIFGETITLYFNGTSWQTEELPNEDPAEVTISNFSIGSRNTETTLDIVIGSGQIQSDFHSVGQSTNLCDQGGDFSKVSTVGSYKIYGIVGVLTTSRTSIVLFPNADYVEKGTAIIIPKDATIVIGEQKVIFGETITLYFNGETWQTEELPKEEDPAEVTISNFTIGSTNTAGAIDIVIGNGQIQSDFHSVGQSTNLSKVDFYEGTFGDVSTQNGQKFYTRVGVLTTSRTSIIIFPLASLTVKDSVIIIPEGATITYNGQTVTFGEELKLTYNGVNWYMGEDGGIDATALTISGIDSRTYVDASTYYIYLNVNVTAPARWSGWDNVSKVYVNGTEKKADGWCFDKDYVLYVQVTTTETPNPITIKAGTLLNIAGVIYEITEDFNIYYYDNSFHTEPKA